MLYEDFHLRIEADSDDFAVRATFRESRATAKLTLPLELRAEGGASEKDPEWIGEHLFRAIFREDVLSLFENSRGEMSRQPSHGMRLRIHFDPKETRLLPLLNLPWEILRNPRDGRLLGLSRRTPIVRSIDTACALQTISIGQPVRVLLAMAAPRQADALDLAGEKDRIEQALSRRTEIDLRILEHATQKELRRRIRGERFHVIHFMGHGMHYNVERSGALVLESPDGSIAPLKASSFASFFEDIEEPALVILNACRTASAPPGLGPLTGVAAALVAEGLPAVLAMRTEIEDETALEFSEELYLHLAAGESVEAALAEARQALLVERPDALEWAIPALFVRGQSQAPLVASVQNKEVQDRSERDKGKAEAQDWSERDKGAQPGVLQNITVNKVRKLKSTINYGGQGETSG